MAIHLGKQERLPGLAHCAVIFCRIAGGPIPQLHVVEMMEGDLQVRRVVVSSQGFDWFSTFLIFLRKHADCWVRECWLKEHSQERIQLAPLPLYSKFSHQNERKSILKIAWCHLPHTTALVNTWLPQLDSQTQKLQPPPVEEMRSPRGSRVQKQHYCWCCPRLLQTQST